jgi:hypothetical protein
MPGLPKVSGVAGAGEPNDEQLPGHGRRVEGQVQKNDTLGKLLEREASLVTRRPSSRAPSRGRAT